MRTFLGVALIVLGLPVLLIGGGATAYVGPDDTFTLVDQQVATDTAVLASDPSLLDWTGPTMHVTAEADDADTFIGVAHPVHVDSYLDGVAVGTIGDAAWRGEFEVETTGGDAEAPPAPPADLDWWRDQAAGPGPQTVTFELTEEPARVVITRADLSAPVSVQLSVDAELDGLFVTALLIAVGGLVLVILGVLLIIAGRRRKRAAARGRSGDPWPAGSNPGTGKPDIAQTTSLPRRTPGQSGMPRRAAVATGLSTLVLAGCAQVPDAADHANHTSVVAITPEAADEFFAHYTETNNAANAEQDADLIATVEGGTLLESSRMGYEIQQAQDREPTPPFTVSPTLVAAPEFDGYPMWFLAVAGSDAEDAPAYYLVSREDASAPWRATLSVYPAADADVPRPVITDGAATLAPSDVATRGNDVLSTIVEYAETGTEPENVDLSNAGGLNALNGSGLEIVEGPEKPVNVERNCALRDDNVHWLSTGSGALATAAIACRQQVTLDEGFSLSLGDAGYGTLPGATNLVALEITNGVSFVISVDDDGTASVVGESMLPYAMDYTEE